MKPKNRSINRNSAIRNRNFIFFYQRNKEQNDDKFTYRLMGHLERQWMPTYRPVNSNVISLIAHLGVADVAKVIILLSTEIRSKV